MATFTDMTIFKNTIEVKCIFDISVCSDLVSDLPDAIITQWEASFDLTLGGFIKSFHKLSSYRRVGDEFP